jgi:predicted ATPase/DNA-binding CsgD family transcriptional regulator
MLTPFVGRENELAEIVGLLTDSACRLLTLTGPGGIGKTRLAIEAAKRMPCSDRVYFVPLQPLTSPDLMLSTIADALGFQFYSGIDSRQQLLNYLREKSLLLVLDNVEHLLDDITLLSDMLTTAPGVDLLATSRERLNLREEWVLNVGGLGYPVSEAETELEGYSAVELFVQHAHRAAVGFTLENAHKSAVIRICRLIEGMPLGIELAAAWVRALSCQQIADEIERSLDVLETSIRNVEPRHRNMRAAFEPTWNRLSEAERGVFMRLSVFRSGFRREAAKDVAGASLATLARLVDKSLLRVNGSGRYDLHELLRQYGEEKLAESSAEQERAQDRHCSFYAEFMGQWVGDHGAIARRDVLAQIREEIENVRLAFQRALERQLLNELSRFVDTLGPFYEVSGWHHEGADAYHLATECLRDKADGRSEQQARLMGLALSWQSWFLQQYLLHYDEARQLAQESLALLLPLGPGFGVYSSYKVLCFTAPDHTEARKFAQEGLKHAREIGYYLGVITMYTRLSQISFTQGDYEEAGQLAQEALALCQKHNWHYGEIWARQRLSDVALARQNFDEARRIAQEALSTAEAIGTRQGMSPHHNVLGNIAFLRGDYAEAKAHYRASLFYAQELGHQQYILWAGSGLGRAAARMGATHEAREHFREPLKIAKDTPNTDIKLDTLAGIADLMATEGDAERAAELLVHRLKYPDMLGRFRLLDERLHTVLRAALSPEVYAAACERGMRQELGVVLADLLVEFSQPVKPIDPPIVSQPLEEPLTERELEILRLIAEGLNSREIAHSLYLGVGTIRWYVKQIYSKLHVHSRSEALARARELNLLA